MISNYQRDAYKALWMVTLLLCLAETLFGQTRLGLHARGTEHLPAACGERALKTKGDVCTNSPGD